MRRKGRVRRIRVLRRHDDMFGLDGQTVFQRKGYDVTAFSFVTLLSQYMAAPLLAKPLPGLPYLTGWKLYCLNRQAAILTGEQNYKLNVYLSFWGFYSFPAYPVVFVGTSEATPFSTQAGSMFSLQPLFYKVKSTALRDKVVLGRLRPVFCFIL